MSSGEKAYRIKSGSSQFPVYKDREKPAHVRVKDLLSRMTLEEKAAQMMWGMVGFMALTAIAYAPTIPLIWAIYADVADYSEWKTGYRFTGMVFATIGFGWKAYDGLVWDGFKHHRVHHHENEFARGKRHINGIESFWSFAKTRLAKQRGVRADKFPLHLKESEWRWNHRRDNLYALLLKETRSHPLN
jgi:hypothetical protein